ncbi:hypothetical protein GCM10010365_55900 [Streptomyces poonensis]|uniref:Hydrolase n=1 Tax=Streptomyces poonensis TaxID=68255 RepID=A0A918Q0Q2_9ACTN|nr:hypothetical protein GCM10010365_55900 [Streptomyces poonensis]GLJ89820.1 hypothetical protein GCM10017589_24210 [Streptomyces poonensis]
MEVQPGQRPAAALRDVRAVVFDTDGVITDSARVHAAAWKTAFDACLTEHPPEARAASPLRRPGGLPAVRGRQSRLGGAAAFLGPTTVAAVGGWRRPVPVPVPRVPS